MLSGVAAASNNPFRSVSQFELDNGLSFYHAKLDEAQFFKFTVYVWAGSLDEQKGVDEGVAHFLEHLMFNQQDVSEVEFENVVKSMGGSYNAFTHRPYTRFYIYLPKQSLQEGVELLWRVVFNTDLIADSVEDVKQIIDRENGWSEPTWLDRLRELFKAPRYLEEKGFWQQHFAMPAVDQPVGGRAKVARKLQFADAKRFHTNFYTTPNMTAVYVGPHTVSEVNSVVKPLVERIPGNRKGSLNKRTAEKPQIKTTDTYGNLRFNDQDSSITLGYLLNDVDYTDYPFLTLYRENLKRHLYENIRLQSAETYAIQSQLELYLGAGYLTFTSQASRFSFAGIQRYMATTIWDPTLKELPEESFERSKKDYLQYMASRLHRVDLMDAYLGFLVRSHPTYKPLGNELDWIANVEKVDYASLTAWTKRELNPKRRYLHLEAPSRFLPYENLLLILLVLIATFVLWRQLLLKPDNIRQVQSSIPLSFMPFGLLQMIVVFYISYLFALHISYSLNRLLDWFTLQGVSLYIIAYLYAALNSMLVVTTLFLAGMLLPRRILITTDRLTVKSINSFSFALPFETIKSAHLLKRFGIFCFYGVPLHLFFRQGIRIERRQGISLLFRVRELTVFLEVLKRALSGEHQDKRQITFPGMSLVKTDSD